MTNSVEGVDSKEIGTMLARAFLDDPIFVYLVDDAAKRLVFLTRLMQVSVHITQHGHGVVLAPGVHQAALFFAPGRYPPSFWLDARRSLVVASSLLLKGMTYRKTKEGLVINNRMQENLKKYATDSWYLMVIGIDPSSQGQGLGGRLLASFCSQVDNTQKSAYLETTNPANIGYYQRYGFKVVDEIRLPKVPPIWCMRRPVKP